MVRCLQGPVHSIWPTRSSCPIKTKRLELYPHHKFMIRPWPFVQGESRVLGFSELVQSTCFGVLNRINPPARHKMIATILTKSICACHCMCYLFNLVVPKITFKYFMQVSPSNMAWALRNFWVLNFLSFLSWDIKIFCKAPPFSTQSTSTVK